MGDRVILSRQRRVNPNLTSKDVRVLEDGLCDVGTELQNYVSVGETCLTLDSVYYIGLTQNIKYFENFPPCQKRVPNISGYLSIGI